MTSDTTSSDDLTMPITGTLRVNLEALSVALSQCERRDDTRPQPEIRRAANTAMERRAVERARELAEAAATVETLASYLGLSTQQPSRFFFAAYGAAMDRMRDLLASLDEAGAGQPDPDGDPPHAYIPAGPVEAAPYEGYCPPEVRQRRSPQSWRAWRPALTTAGSSRG